MNIFVALYFVLVAILIVMAIKWIFSKCWEIPASILLIGIFVMAILIIPPNGI